MNVQDMFRIALGVLGVWLDVAANSQKLFFLINYQEPQLTMVAS